MTTYEPNTVEEWQTGGEKYEPTLGSVVIQLTRMEERLVEAVDKNHHLEIIRRMIAGRRREFADCADEVEYLRYLLAMIMGEIDGVNYDDLSDVDAKT